jgi:hypothetical protein
MSGAVVTRLAELERELATLAAEDLPRLLGELARLQAIGLVRARGVGQRANDSDGL